MFPGCLHVCLFSLCVFCPTDAQNQPNNFELFGTSILPIPGVFSEQLPPTHLPDTFPSLTGTPAETYCSPLSDDGQVPTPRHLLSGGFQPSEAHQTKQPAENQYYFHHGHRNRMPTFPSSWFQSDDLEHQQKDCLN